MRSPSTPRAASLASLGVFAVLGQVGCLTVIILFTALGIGLWLDGVVGRRGLFTIVLVVVSIPLSLWINYKLAMRTAKRFSPVRPAVEPESTLKED